MYSIDRIKNLVNSLPDKDIELGNKFIERRDFEALSDLANSALVILKKELNKDTPREDYANLSIDNITTLISEIDTYSLSLDLNIGKYDDLENTEEDGYC